MKKMIRNTLLTAVLLLTVTIATNAADPTGTGPFLVVETATKYPTLQQAVDAATSGNTIKVLPCSEFGETEYGASYATNVSGMTAEDGGAEVYVKDKSLTITTKDGKDSAPLRNFAIVLEGSASKCNYTFDDLKFLGASIIILDNTEASASYGKIKVNNCYADVCNKTGKGDDKSKHRKLKKTGHSLGNTNTSGAFVQWIQYYGYGTTDEVEFTNNTVIVDPFDTGSTIRFINGDSRATTTSIHDNIFGSEAKSNGYYIITYQKIGLNSPSVEIYDNTIYLKWAEGPVLFGAGTHTTGNATGALIKVYDNTLICGDQPTRRPFNNDGTVNNSLVRLETSIAGKIITYHNYVNGYCFNAIQNLGNSGLDVQQQHGHTWDYGDTGAHIKNVPASDTKNTDIYYQNKACEYNEATGEFIEHDLGDVQYCDRCDVLYAIPGLKITANGLEEGQSAVFIVSRSVSSVDTPLLQVMITGEDGGGGSRTVLGLETGDYKVVPASWSWTYSINPASKSVTLDGTNQAEAEFTLEKKDPSTLPENAEKAKVKKF